MMRGEAGIDMGELLGLGIVDRHLATAPPSIGNSFADGWSEPLRQNAGVSGWRMRDVIHTRPS